MCGYDDGAGSVTRWQNTEMTEHKAESGTIDPDTLPGDDVVRDEVELVHDETDEAAMVLSLLVPGAF